MSFLVAILLAQAGTTVIVDPTVQSKRAKVTTTAGGALQVECVGGTCTGGGASGGGGDGGYTIVIQGPGADGGQAWGVTGTVTVVGPLTVNVADAGPPLNVNPVVVSALPIVFVQDAGVLNVQGPVTDTQLRASAVPVSVANLDVALSTRTKPADQQHTIIDSSASIAVTGPLTDTQLRASVVPVYVDGGTILATQGTSPWAVSGTVTTTPPSNASTNVAQFGGTNVSTGTGTGGAGIPRVTISSDSSLAANQSVNLNQVAGAGVATGNGTAAGSVRVSIASDTTGVVAATQSGTWTVQPGNTANTTPWLATARIVGNTGAVIDAANNGAAPANVIVDGFEAQSSALSTSATASNVRRGVVGLDGVFYVREGGPLLFTGGVTAIGATLTQVVAAPAASTSLYLTDVMVMSDTATAGTFVIRYGTSSNCGTGTTSIYPSAVSAAKSMYPGNASAPLMLNFHTPLKIPAANAVCILCVATNTCTAQFWGYTAP